MQAGYNIEVTDVFVMDDVVQIKGPTSVVLHRDQNIASYSIVTEALVHPLKIQWFVEHGQVLKQGVPSTRIQFTPQTSQNSQSFVRVYVIDAEETKIEAELIVDFVAND